MEFALSRLNRTRIGLLLLLMICGTAQATSCPDPAPIQEKFQSDEPGFTVVLKDGVPFKEEVDRLASKYGFQIIHDYQPHVPMLYTLVDENTAQALRCEPTVRLIGRNRAYKPASS